jgi:tetratricopeptide (TPR) repeat protein
VPLRSEVCSALGNLYTLLRDLDAAATWHARAVANEETKARGAGKGRLWNVFHAAAACHAQRGQFLEAVRLDTEALELHSQNARVYFNRALALQKLNQWSDSIPDLTRVVQLDPSNAKALVLRAKALLRQERWKEVVDDCEKALAIAPQDSQAGEFAAFARARIAAAQ